MRQRPFRRGHVLGNLSGTRVRQSPTPIRRFQRKYEREVWANRTNRLPLRYKRPSELIVPPFTSACNASGHHSRSSLLVSRCRVAEAMDVIPRATWHVHEQKVVVNRPFASDLEMGTDPRIRSLKAISRQQASQIASFACADQASSPTTAGQSP